MSPKWGECPGEAVHPSGRDGSLSANRGQFPAILVKVPAGVGGWGADKAPNVHELYMGVCFSPNVKLVPCLVDSVILSFTQQVPFQNILFLFFIEVKSTHKKLYTFSVYILTSLNICRYLQSHRGSKHSSPPSFPLCSCMWGVCVCGWLW